MNRRPTALVLSLVLALLYSGLITALVGSGHTPITAEAGAADSVESLSVIAAVPAQPQERSNSLRLRLTLPFMPSGPARSESQEI